LEIHNDNISTNCEAVVKTSNEGCFYLRLKIINIGREISQDCIAEVIEPLGAAVGLRWDGLPMENGFSAISLFKDQWQYLNIIRFKKSGDGKWEAAIEVHPLFNAVQQCKLKATDKHIIAIHIYSKNTKSIMKKYEFSFKEIPKIDGNPEFDFLEIS
jgi:hypothetical protein